MSEHVATLHAVISQEGAWYVARCLEVEVTSQGKTIDDALANLREALELYFEDEPLPRHPSRLSLLLRCTSPRERRFASRIGAMTVRALKRAGFEQPPGRRGQRGSHVKLRHPTTRRTAIVPLHQETGAWNTPVNSSAGGLDGRRVQ
jgi:predicted RNase H-like HicB family nuclease/predicted RNA binding protein YcfA (HicA-like mRNA interferase family)